MAVQEHDVRDLAIELLHSMKRFYKFRELESILGISTPTLWRYIHGEIKPSPERAREIINRLLSPPVLEEVKRKIVSVRDGIVNVYPLAYSIDVLTIAAIDAYLWARDLGPSVVLTTEVDGIPLATLIAKKLGVSLLVAKRRREVGYSHFLETSYLAYDPPEVRTIYLPKEVLPPNERVLIVDDLVRSGRTTRALIDIVRQARSIVVGFYALIGYGPTWRSALKSLVGDRYRVLFEVQ
ncbi:MAG: hypothetical protein GXO32_07785 [Crenarchaeota archaeon]|nr:hypothetical protein [Thermoproteota archaeon]